MPFGGDLIVSIPTTFISRCLFNPLNAELNPICHLLALLGPHHILHVSRIRVKCYNGQLSESSIFQCHIHKETSIINQAQSLSLKKQQTWHPPDMNHCKNLWNYNLHIVWTNSPLLQTNFLISADILWTSFNVFNNPSVFWYAPCWC